MGSKLQDAKAIARMEMDDNGENMVENNESFIDNIDETDEAQAFIFIHYFLNFLFLY